MLVIRSKLLLLHFIFIFSFIYETTAAPPNPIPHEVVKRSLNEEFKDKLQTNLSFIEENLETVNHYRELHGVPPMVLDYKLCYECEQFASKLANLSREANKITLDHSHKYKVGENVMGTYSMKKASGKFVADHWYSEIKNHNWADNFFNYKSAHFTQLIWKDTKKMGIARIILPSTGKKIKPIIIIVARYIPNGNWAYHQSFQKNVFPLVEKATDSPPEATEASTS